MEPFHYYLICFGVGLLFTIISAFMADVFGGHADAAGGADAHAEGGFASNEVTGFSPISPTTAAAFLTAFGGFGMIFSKWSLTASAWISAPLAGLVGVGVAFLVFLMFRAVFRRTQSSSESKVAALVGSGATIITPIPENGVGEIAYVDSGTRYSAPARAENNLSIPAGAPVVISRIIGTQFFVKRS